MVIALMAFAIVAFLLLIDISIFPPKKATTTVTNTNTTTNQNQNTNTAGTTTGTFETNSNAGTDINTPTNENTNASIDTNTSQVTTPAGGVVNGVYTNTTYDFQVTLDGMTCGPFTCGGDADSMEFYLGEGGAIIHVGKLGSATTAQQWLKNAGLNHPDIALNSQTVGGLAGTSFINTNNYQDYPGYLSNDKKVSLVVNTPSGGKPTTLMSSGGSRGFAVVHNGYVIVIHYTAGLGQAPKPEVYDKILDNITFTN